VILWTVVRAWIAGLAPLERDHREGHAVDVDVLFREEPGFRIGRVVHAPQAASHNLLAEQPPPECAKSKDVRDVVRVPALGQHLDAHDAANVFAGLSGPSDRRNEFAKLFGCVLPGSTGARLGLGEGGSMRCQRRVHNQAWREIRRQYVQ
jgi:hypothetical protein